MACAYTCCGYIFSVLVLCASVSVDEFGGLLCVCVAKKCVFVAACRVVCVGMLLKIVRECVNNSVRC